MKDYIIIGILLTVVSYGVYYTVNHFKKKSGCCGGGGYKLKKKRLSNVIYRKNFRVDGMHCNNCKVRVEEIVNDIKGIAGTVDMKKNELTVSYAEDVSDDLIIERIKRAGYGAALIE